MENLKGQDQSKINLINRNNNYPPSTKILRSKSKNIYTQQKHIKSKINSNTYAKPKIFQRNYNNNNSNNQNLNKINMNSYNKNNKNIQKNIENENNVKKSELIELNKLKYENIELKKTSIQQDELLKQLHDLFIHNYNKLNTLRKKYSHYKKYLEKTLYDEDKNDFIKEKIEEEFALRAVEEQIMNEICPNPDQMSYEQLLQLEEDVGKVNKGLSKDKIKQIPNKPFHKALFEDNGECIICMESFSENELVKQLMCGHIFHGDCIDHWLTEQKNCPFCKAECIVNIQ